VSVTHSPESFGSDSTVSAATAYGGVPATPDDAATTELPAVTSEAAGPGVPAVEPSGRPTRLIGGQPAAVWVVAFAAMVSFMGIGLVDPILKSIAGNLGASASQVSLLFTSYLLVTAFAMLITSFFSSRLGGRNTLIIGLIVIIVFSSLAGTSPTVAALIGWRAGWGLGNALFIATALAAIVAVARGGAEKAITLYEAALGIGISAGPLVGAVLGNLQWRLPFYGVAVLMAIALIAIVLLLKDRVHVMHGVSVTAPLRALSHGGLLVMGISALLYNGGFFAVLAWTPFAVPLGVYGIGFMFFGWGVLVGIFAVWGAPWMHRRFGLIASFGMAIGLFSLILVGVALAVIAGSVTAVVILVIACGIPLGVLNTLFTQSAMNIAPVPRPVASAGYNFVRFLGGAVSPWICGKLGDNVGPAIPFWFGAACVAAALAVLLGFGTRYLRAINTVH
jgi:predicted MFS family arabinose efflux permease